MLQASAAGSWLLQTRMTPHPNIQLWLDDKVFGMFVKTTGKALGLAQGNGFYR